MNRPGPFALTLVLVAAVATALTALAAIGTDELATKANGTLYAPASTTMAWETAIAAGGVDDQDAATITNPTTQITASTRYLLTLPANKQGAGTFITVRLAYDDGLTGITDPVIAVFGRMDASDVWMRLPNRAGGSTCTLTTAATDVTDGTLLYTMPSAETSTFYRFGCEQFLVGVETPLAGTGTTSNAIVQVKVHN